MAKKKKSWGGARPRVGRKPVDDRKVQLAIYIQQSIVNKLGKDRVREIATEAVESAARATELSSAER